MPLADDIITLDRMRQFPAVDGMPRLEVPEDQLQVLRLLQAGPMLLKDLAGS